MVFPLTSAWVSLPQRVPRLVPISNRNDLDVNLAALLVSSNALELVAAHRLSLRLIRDALLLAPTLPDRPDSDTVTAFKAHR